MSSHTMFWTDEPDLQRRDIEIEFRGIKYLGHLVAPAKGCWRKAVSVSDSQLSRFKVF